MKKNYLDIYAAKTPKFQDGGSVSANPNNGAPDAGAGVAPAGGQPDIEGMLKEFASSQDPQLAVTICNAILAAMGGGGAPAAAPAPSMRKGGRMNTAAPMFRKGGKLI